MEAPGVLGCGGHLYPALIRELLDAEVTPDLEESDHFDPAVVRQAAGQLCPTAVIVSHKEFFITFLLFAKSKNKP